MIKEKPLTWLPTIVATVTFWAAACSSSGDPTPTGGTSTARASGGAGGSVGSASGGKGSAGDAGLSSTGGTILSGGSAMSGGTGGGGSLGLGGVVGSGGVIVGGGGASPGTGGAALAGGTPSAEGGFAKGGTTAGGGTSSGTGATPSGGARTGGVGSQTGGSLVGGSGQTGGVLGSGGVSTTGGSLGAGGSTGSCPAIAAFATWDASKGPADIGKLAVENFKPRTSEAYGGDGYAWTFGYVGALQFTKTVGDTTNNDYLVGKFNCSQTGPDNGASASVDTRAFGDLPLEIFIETQKAACKTLGLSRADAQWNKTTADGLSSDVRYWIDDMYMITSLQVFAYRATKDIKYLERSAKTMLSYIAELQKNNDTKTDGLFWHTRQSKAYWGRANGWVASGMTELLLDLPAGDNRTKILAAYKRQMDGLLPHQIASGTDAGAWRQVIDRSDAKPEMSCTAMFTFALVTGVKNGWLTDEKYIAAAVNGWKALANRTNSSGALAQVCPGTGQAASGDLASQQKFYMNIAFPANDRHGQGPELWAATALLRKDCPGLR